MSIRNQTGDDSPPDDATAEAPAGDAAPAAVLDVGAAAALVTPTVAVAAQPVARRKRSSTWRNPEMDGEREQMRAELDEMLAEARDPFFETPAERKPIDRVRLGLKAK